VECANREQLQLNALYFNRPTARRPRCYELFRNIKVTVVGLSKEVKKSVMKHPKL